jgi:hypothetical protein
MLSLCVPKEELGKIYSFLSFIDGILPFAVSEVYAKIWTVSSFIIYPYVTIVTMYPLLINVCYITCHIINSFLLLDY